jgi:hypothetical protein
MLPLVLHCLFRSWMLTGFDWFLLYNASLSLAVIYFLYYLQYRVVVSMHASFICTACIVRSSKLMELCCSFLIVNFILVVCLLNSVSVSSMFVLFWLYVMRISSVYLKYPITWCFFKIGYSFLCRSRDSVVGIATSYGLDDRGVWVRVPVGSGIFCSPDRPDQLWGPSNLLSDGYWGLFPRG